MTATLMQHLAEPRRFIQAVVGPRQVGKTTAVHQVLAGTSEAALYASADQPTLRADGWLEAQWEAARLQAKSSEAKSAILVLDEIQKLPEWSEIVKRLWDEDTRRSVPLKVVILGSAPLLISRGLTESLAGRFELVYFPHWSFEEMRSAFGFSLRDYIYFGGYPGAATLVGDPKRWTRYILDSLVETTISRDVLLLSRVEKPALMRRLLDLACSYSGHVLSYTKMLGQLQDAGNTTTLAHYLDLLSAAGMVRGLQKYAGDKARQRGSSPKLQVYNTALMSAHAGLDPAEAYGDRRWWGHLVESAVGSHLANSAASGDIELFYWRERNQEVDFIARAGKRLVAIEVKSGVAAADHSGLATFARTFKADRTLLVGSDSLTVEEFLSKPVSHWIE